MMSLGEKIAIAKLSSSHRFDSFPLVFVKFDLGIMRLNMNWIFRL